MYAKLIPMRTIRSMSDETLRSKYDSTRMAHRVLHQNLERMREEMKRRKQTRRKTNA